MVDSIGGRLVKTDRSVTLVTTPAPVSRVAAHPTTTQLAQAGGLSRTLAATAPIDLDRVARIKQAIADGTFPILPGTIADNLIALRLQWTAEDEA